MSQISDRFQIYVLIQESMDKNANCFSFDQQYKNEIRHMQFHWNVLSQAYPVFHQQVNSFDIQKSFLVIVFLLLVEAGILIMTFIDSINLVLSTEYIY